MFDDIIDTGGSILGAAQRLQDEGALDVELTFMDPQRKRQPIQAPVGHGSLGVLRSNKQTVDAREGR